MTKKRSPEETEKRLLELFARSADGPEVTFSWNLSGRAARIGKLPSGKLRVEINLRFIQEEETTSEGAWEFWLCACANVICRRFRLEEEAAVLTLGTYLQGLAQIEVLNGQSRTRAADLYIPTETLLDRTRGRIRLTPADLFCAIEGLGNALEHCGKLLSSEELEREQNKFQTLELLSKVPEALFFGSKIPKNGIAWCVEAMERLLERRSREASVLHAVCDEVGHLCPPGQLMARTGDPLCRGMALRLFAMSGRDFTPLLTADPAIRRGLEDAVHEFRECSVAFAKTCSRSKGKVLQANLLALERMSERLNAAAEWHGIPCRSGMLHPLM